MGACAPRYLISAKYRVDACLTAPTQATLLRAQYAALGPAFEALAAAHGAAGRRVEEAEFEAREVEQFQRLAGVLG